MSTEIELKYLVVSENVEEKINALLAQESLKFRYSENTLANSYFDTPELFLRQCDIGLRIRDKGGALEQTVKLKGLDVGGLHQRPEYNIDTLEHFPLLTLFPDNIWPNDFDVDSVQNQLIPLFSTNFLRKMWRVSLANGSEIEVVFDQGEVTSKNGQDIITEIELELVSGDVEDILAFASLLFNTLQLRPGTLSKAARGYNLWHGKKPKPFLLAEFLPLNVNASIEESFKRGLSIGLNQLQESVNTYLVEQTFASAAKIYESLMLVRHGFWLFGSYLPDTSLTLREKLSEVIQEFSWLDNAIYMKDLMDKKGSYAKKLAYSKQLIAQLKLEKRRFPKEQDLCGLLYSPLFNQVQLELLNLIISDQAFKKDIIHKQNIIEFARTALTQSLDDLIEGMPDALSLKSEEYIAQSKLLNRSLLTGTWLGSLFSEKERSAYRAPWLDIKQGISELQSFWIINQQLKKLDEQPTKLLDWQDNKVDSLLHALDHSRRIAVSVTPYWQLQ